MTLEITAPNPPVLSYEDVPLIFHTTVVSKSGTTFDYDQNELAMWHVLEEWGWEVEGLMVVEGWGDA